MGTATLHPEARDTVAEERFINGLDAHETTPAKPGFLDDDGLMGPIFTNPFSYD